MKIKKDNKISEYNQLLSQISIKEIEYGDIRSFNNVNHQFVYDNNPNCKHCSLLELCRSALNKTHPCGESIGIFKRVYDENQK